MNESKTCFHCGLPVPENTYLPIRYEQREEPACCAGCQAVAQGIIDAGLGSYYKNRTANAEKAALPPDEILAQLKLYDLPEVQAEFVEVLPQNEKEAMLMLSGITCAACTWLIEQQLLRQSGIVKVELNYSTQRARVRWDNSRVQLSQILHLIQQTGYTASPYDTQKVEAQAQRERKKMLIRLAVAGLVSMQTMMFALPTYLYGDIEPQYLTILHWGGFLMVLPALFYSAQPFYQGAWRDFRNKRTGMDTPIALAITMTFIAGLGALWKGASEGLYFESIAMLVFFLLIGRFMEQSARRKAGDAAERLVRLVPAFCHKIINLYAEQTEEAAVVTLKSGDVLLVRAGEIVPVDGVVLRGESEINEAMLTGESVPIQKKSGSQVTAGTLNTASPLIIQAQQVGNQTRLAHIVKLLDRALSQKPRLAMLAEKYASVFTLAQIVLAIPTFIAWWWYADVVQAVWIVVALLVITCPCALSLATPTALAASMGRLANAGVLVARGHALETLAQVSDAVFDKTGTLTEGKLSVTQFHNFSGSLHDTDLIAIAKLLEQHSEHPIARAILNLSLTLPPLVREGWGGGSHSATQMDESTENHIHIAQKLNKIGHGVSAQITLHNHTQIWAIGKPDFVAEISGSLPEKLSELAQQGSVIVLGNQHGFQAAFLLRDTVKADAADVLAALRSQSIAVHILSGDNAAAVNQLADDLAIERRQAAAMPEDKLRYVQQLQAQGKRVLMLGDGINDAPVLAAADVSVAVAGSADVARDGADIVLLNDDLGALPLMLRQAAKTQAIIRQNLIWATVYNVIVVPLAIVGWVSPWKAAIGMSASSLLVVWNALRLRE
ncbi:heavy metal translocating P-type ATPase [Kingella kingae]|uniref:heavy metal translocating P-type ATPase n=3 Tax=Kingella kingae TaxID=504 RepID=UPI0005C71E4B|nr:heavy metal translocating P-type ATPase [Kingella kingae]MDK4609038.1 heavy metal translocating P-type ATPase [Kingella kingae]MDK4626999.1 heavy metal translocating P-type ATPase [Kingella kingae]MDK4674707.1 heavy metal translocating P-type ATPase [Kingella kingae]